MRYTFVCLLILGLAGAASSAWAQGRPNLVVEIQVEREVYQPDTQGWHEGNPPAGSRNQP